MVLGERLASIGMSGDQDDGDEEAEELAEQEEQAERMQGKEEEWDGKAAASELVQLVKVYASGELGSSRSVLKFRDRKLMGLVY